MKGVRMKPIAPTRQLGQTLLWFLATLAACCALLMIVYNVGQLSTEKEKTVNAADAVAMSGAVVQARGMNLLAYTNRSIVANEVTIAQLASLDSWIKYNAQFADSLHEALQGFPVVDYFTAALKALMDGLHALVYGIANGGTSVLDLAVQILENVQRPAILALVPWAAKDAAEEAAKGNNVQMNDNLAFTQLAFWDNFYNYWIPAVDNNNFFHNSKKDSGPNNQDERGPLAFVIQNSRDQFSSNRNAGAFIDGLNDLLSYSPVSVQFNKSSGSAELVDFDHWESQDSIEASFDLCFFGACVSLFSGPLSWGRANVNQNNDTGNDWVAEGRCKNGAGVGSACDFAYSVSFPSPPDQISGFTGVPDLLDVKDRSKDLRYYVSVKKAGDATMTTQRLNMDTTDVGGPPGSPKVTDNLNNDEIPAIAAARIFFSRPKRDPNADPTAITAQNLTREDNVKELASLYNPYWQARLHTPNCKFFLNPTSDDCIWRGLLFGGSNQTTLLPILDKGF
jgi:Putative Flp pilus-assembly TadE/G-like